MELNAGVAGADSRGGADLLEAVQAAREAECQAAMDSAADDEVCARLRDLPSVASSYARRCCAWS